MTRSVPSRDTRLRSLLLGLGAAGCAALPPPPAPLPVLDPRYPAEPVLDYRPQSAFAHAALPAFDVDRARYVGGGRVWVKGDAGLHAVRVDGGPSVELGPPLDSAVLSAEPGHRTVVFGDDAVRIEVMVPGPDDLTGGREVQAGGSEGSRGEVRGRGAISRW